MSKNPNLCNEFEKFGFQTTIFFTKVVDFGGRSERKKIVGDFFRSVNFNCFFRFGFFFLEVQA